MLKRVDDHGNRYVQYIGTSTYVSVTEILRADWLLPLGECKEEGTKLPTTRCASR